MKRTTYACLLLLAMLLFPALPVHAAEEREPAASWQWDDVSRVVAIGDVHGSYEKLLSLLQGIGLIDAQNAWTGGAQHLVFCGDLVDRGPDDRAALDLVRRLQQEAIEQKGRVHVLLGNHEVLNLTRDLRYVAPGGFASFADLDDPTERSADFESFRAQNMQTGMSSAAIRNAFTSRRPAGFYGRLHAFDPDGLYGSWLLQQPAVIRINGVLFVHGGLTEAVAGLGLQGINDGVRQSLLDYFRYRDAIAATLDGTPTYGEIQRAAEAIATGRSLLALDDALPFSSDGPLWYRGNALENERFERTTIDAVLESLDASAIVIAHTPTGSGRITARYSGKLYRSDVGMAYGGNPFAITIDTVEGKNNIRVYDPSTLSLTQPNHEPPQGEGWSAVQEQLTDRKLEQLLTRGKLSDRQPRTLEERSFELIEVERKGLAVRAVFQFSDEKPAPDTPPESWNPRRYQHEIAAYKLDRRLGLGMVPVTVARKIGGRPGSLRLFLESAIDLPFVRDRNRWDLLEGLDRQIGRARIFSALIGARDRNDAAKMLLPRERQIMLGDHSKGFPLTAEVEDLLTIELDGRKIDSCTGLDADLELALRSLTSNILRADVGDFLDASQITAILVRRDAILGVCGS